MPFPYIMLFSMFMILTTLFIPSSTNWLLTWSALELNLLSFIPLISSTNSHQETESSIKYFLAQALGSSLLISTALISPTNSPLLSPISPVIMLLFIISLMIKLGVGPLHFWFPSVMMGLSWFMVLTLSTWQKLAPLFILTTLTACSPLMPIMIMGSLSAMIGGFGGLNQTYLRPILAYSSIGHLGWLMTALSNSPSLMISYFTLYTLILLPIILIFYKTNMSSTQFSSNKYTTPTLLLLMLLFLSLGGIPPLLGFFPKWMLLNHLLQFQMWPSLAMLISGSLINIFYYMIISITTFYSISYTHQTRLTVSSSTNLFPLLSTTMISIIPLIILFIYALTLLY